MGIFLSFSSLSLLIHILIILVAKLIELLKMAFKSMNRATQTSIRVEATLAEVQAQ